MEFSWENMFKSLIARGKYLLFIAERSSLKPAELEALEMTPLNIFIGICQGFMSYYSYMVSICSSGVYLMAVITLWNATDDFVTKSILNIDSDNSDLLRQYETKESVQTTKKNQLFTVRELQFGQKETHFKYFLNSYTDLKILTTDLNEALGEVFLIYPIVVCFNYATALKGLFTSVGWINPVLNYYQLIQKVVTFIIAAEICRKVGCWRNCLINQYCSELLYIGIAFSDGLG